MKTYIFNHSKLNVNWRSKIFILFFTIVSFVSCTDLSESTLNSYQFDGLI